MVDAQKYNIIDLETGTLDHRIFSNAVIYQEEQEKVF